ncbi:VPLPA-CTERM sorting domain-containing protein [Pseudodesulfovibrio portus]|uniref:VPLPA-CTERM protein sorting domain-containing protein n=1 Tax=Pseudodesulfovibrio portus TaxID=231439 RepID=A0ABM8AV60_9BACT|nr:VPLPA-CTERM sorting domain-containing protein [Pseudodesulfovibrio portus]BDQ35439.1 hypothetical protein JCM14722_29810 [Pseudodesulfovibrio portus]
MKKLFLLTLLTAVLSSSMAFAMTATIQFTTDNQLTELTLNGKSIIPTATITGNLDDWREVKSFNFEYDPSQSYLFTWSIKNYDTSGKAGTEGSSTLPTSGNPIGFIAQVDLDGTPGWELTSQLDQYWSVAGDYGVEYDYGTGAWGNRPASISSDAKWLSVTDGASTMEASLTLTPTPIPGAAWLLGSGLVGLVGLRRRFKS